MVIVEKDGNVIEEVPIFKSAVFSRLFERGYYIIKLQKSGEYVEFCVNKAEISHKIDNGFITVKADPCDKNSEIVYMDFRRGGKPGASLVKYEELTAEEKQTGVFTREIPENAKSFKVYFSNNYGIWVHQKLPF